MTRSSASRHQSHLRRWLPILAAIALLLVIAYVRSQPTPAAPTSAFTPAPTSTEAAPTAAGFQAGEAAVLADAHAERGATADEKAQSGQSGRSASAIFSAESTASSPAANVATTETPRATATINDGLATIAFADLPRQAQDTIRLIARGGPYPYRQDGAVFQNRERLLPRHPNGYYREYTVKTSGESDRGARRIVAGAGGELYYTGDHYASFQRVVQ